MLRNLAQQEAAAAAAAAAALDDTTALDVDVDAGMELEVGATQDSPPPEPVSPLHVASHVASSPAVRTRIVAHVQARRWADENADPTAPVPVELLASAVASDQDVLTWLTDCMENSAEQIRHETERACAALPDSVIVTVVDRALARLDAAQQGSGA